MEHRGDNSPDGIEESGQEDPRGKLIARNRDFLEAKAGVIATDYGIRHDRVFTILRDTIMEDLGGVYFWPSFSEALSYLKPEVAITLFEEQGVKRIAERDGIVRVLANPAIPLLSLDELRAAIDDFVPHLESNRQHVVETGLPLQSFGRCPWLDHLLGCLYPCKLPARVVFNPSDCGGTKYSYSWAGITPVHPKRKCSPELIRHFSMGAESTRRALAEIPDSEELRWELNPDAIEFSRLDFAGNLPFFSEAYSAAACAPGLSHRDEERVRALRPLLLDLIVEILDCLSDSLGSMNANEAWTNCSRILSNGVGVDTAAFLSEIQKDLWNNSQFWFERDGVFLGIPIEQSGGIDGILELISHCVVEIKIRWHDTVRQALGDLVSVAPNRESNLLHRTYFGMVAAGEMQRVAVACKLDATKRSARRGVLPDLTSIWGSQFQVKADALRAQESADTSTVRGVPGLDPASDFSSLIWHSGDVFRKKRRKKSVIFRFSELRRPAIKLLFERLRDNPGNPWVTADAILKCSYNVLQTETSPIRLKKMLKGYKVADLFKGCKAFSSIIQGGRAHGMSGYYRLAS
ncbi:hypothetical protein HZB60_09010 [candidate division KSB1 bacterium]|nr:hypothetical protein [candidate division KSB1 bacterium]